jgi:hypothetical protein
MQDMVIVPRQTLHMSGTVLVFVEFSEVESCTSVNKKKTLKKIFTSYFSADGSGTAVIFQHSPDLPYTVHASDTWQ